MLHKIVVQILVSIRNFNELMIMILLTFILASRIREIHDFGMVTLDISSTVAEDSGVYMCKAFNKAGEAVTSTSMVVRGIISTI